MTTPLEMARAIVSRGEQWAEIAAGVNGEQRQPTDLEVVARALIDLADNCEMILASEVWRGDEDKPLPAWALHLRDVLKRLRTERSPDEPA